MGQPEFIEQTSRRLIENDIAERTRIHQSEIARFQAAQDGARTLKVKSRNTPYTMLAQGDSWFDYPLTGNTLPYARTDVIAQLGKMGSTPPKILNLAHHGDAATEEMSLPKQERMITALRDRANWLHGKPDAILFSAGGNDIAGNQFCIFLDFNDGHSTGLNADRFNKALGIVEACYLALFALRDRLAPGVPVFSHCYDFPIPNGVSPWCIGPWLKPSIDFCNWTVPQGKAIVHDALVAFRVMLKRLESDAANNFHVVETQGILKPADWANELHPHPAGFKKIAQKFATALGHKLQKRVPYEAPVA
ncbi:MULTISPECIES: SGNH/GDSL hydrolase family protein [unclassified Mesorhizobium]|uniref:SGNH/GDSL hydrolase family protein n=1 Tax=unclassified Mesorhizobium TaxID=325217 RepID=UPI000960B2D5|nr:MULTISPECIES: SGNH/GDSL hydrolase family protein [unclassified Mesorhizobium]MBN9257895.1 SGNH/GDSL hydrolase family protein [Mesorhizobium sp.]OJX79125.1 MAG: hypothetical protein BGO93_12360 [Mesorhizobium sp. 65-26]